MWSERSPWASLPAGYGDVYPTTTPGRILAIAVMLVGIGFIATLTGSLAQRFVATDVRAIETEVAEEAEAMVAILGELRAVRQRLTDLEARIQRTASVNR
jgi:hypothetical protein